MKTRMKRRTNPLNDDLKNFLRLLKSAVSPNGWVDQPALDAAWDALDREETAEVEEAPAEVEESAEEPAEEVDEEVEPVESPEAL